MRRHKEKEMTSCQRREKSKEHWEERKKKREKLPANNDHHNLIQQHFLHYSYSISLEASEKSAVTQKRLNSDSFVCNDSRIYLHTSSSWILKSKEICWLAEYKCFFVKLKCMQLSCENL
jgi:hypothetical protein